MSDPVNNPAHYTYGRVETIDVLEQVVDSSPNCVWVDRSPHPGWPQRSDRHDPPGVDRRMTQAIASGRPAYELRSKQRGPSDLELEVWQVPSTATPELKEPRRIAGLGGHKLLLVEGAVLRRLKAEQVSLAKLKKGEARRDALSEDLALAMGLLFKLLAPMRNVAAIENCARGIDAMAREEAAYWLGMAMHRKNPRRVLAALRLLLSAS